MDLILITGGARAGKSGYAQRRARTLGGDEVTVIATARPEDEDMVRRIERHRLERPAAWRCIEAPCDAASALRSAGTDVVLLDCLTLLVANALLDRADLTEQAAALEIERLIEAMDGRRGTLLVVTNEVGLGVVPATPSGRRFRDVLGLANQRLAARADRVIVMVSGLPLTVKPARVLSEG